MLYEVYEESGNCIRHHCGAEPSRDFEPPGFVTTVGWRDRGFVESTVDAQRRLYRLKPEPLQEVDAWLAPFRRFWSAHVDALERHLDRMEQSTPTKATPTKRKK